MKLALLFFLTINFYSTLNAIEVMVDASAKIFKNNTAHAKKQALKNVLFKAVKITTESLMDSNKMNTNYGVIKDQIYRYSEKFIRNYEIIGEKEIYDRNLYEISIIADIDKQKIKQELKILRILSDKTKRKSLIMIYHKLNPVSLPRKNESVIKTIDSVLKSFRENSFRTLNKEKMQQIYSIIDHENIVGRSIDSLIALSLNFNADLLVIMGMNVKESYNLDSAFYKVTTDVNFSIFDTLTGQQISETKTESYEISTKKLSIVDLEKLAINSGMHAGIENVRKSVNHINSYFQNLGFIEHDYSIEFKGYSPHQENTIIDYFENTSEYQKLSELKNTLGFLEFELFSKKRKSILRRKIMSDLLEHEIEVASKSIAGNRLVFINPDPLEEGKLTDNKTKISITE